jgi:hypothetical protein
MFEVSRQLWLWICIVCNKGISIPAEMIVLSGGLGGCYWWFMFAWVLRFGGLMLLRLVGYWNGLLVRFCFEVSCFYVGLAVVVVLDLFFIASAMPQ